MNEIKVFFTALLFYTRIPCPVWVNSSPENLNNATRYLPIIGWLVGSACAFTLFLSLFLFQLEVAIVLSMAAGILLTGAFHEDGFADVCDGFGGGWTKEKILEIMKDSRVGAYGVIGILMMLLLKFMAIKQLSPDIRYGSLICGHTFSRLSAVIVIRYNKYARETDNSKVKFVAEKITGPHFLLSLLFGLLPLIFFHSVYSAFLIIPLICVPYFMSNYFKKWIGGYTGDCLGAVQQVSEVVYYLSAHILYYYFNYKGIITTFDI